MKSMTPQDHYNEAERLLDGPEPGISDYDEARRDNLAEALVHATLAVAGFTRENRPSRVPMGFPG